MIQPLGQCENLLISFSISSDADGRSLRSTRGNSQAAKETSTANLGAAVPVQSGLGDKSKPSMNQGVGCGPEGT